ncbi:MAG TPA: NADH-dependent [FeFe] hydrogenase, group A6 [Kiritimatiellia bacterium]|jgi:NADH-quinone oxidoreductase subunit G|nr:NADH-dependent [FeFe] hydrogenase, group A6 [Kiritimatiellia bacterium]HOR73852.1 NADH-dependent [FeFe] hydrogenase, group A6 [Kiritimatiellia bacterium]HOU58501.1 NADH-dependent [FeFe] hydrogenase, group A6 [Kiritimatiellia bacterium]HPK68905.1 NADH-dependent [FeFe] hydrogenase, group A6 [Kiritimatiellia bacterium]HPV46301.1 NADH-dependent [FeFe] hydrogenase, group A6 [Kiritimatiellia bacterium]
MKMVKLTINGLPVEVPEGVNILNAARQVQVKIPSLCYHPDLPPWAACGICVVKVKGLNKLVRACAAPAAEGQEIITHDSELFAIRRTIIELILSTHPDDCLQCPRNQNCELQRLAAEFGIREAPYGKRLRDLPEDDTTGSLVLNPEKCILCGRCAAVCQDMQGVWALEFIGRGENTRIAPAADVTLNESPCIKCGQCSAHCPVGAIYEHSHAREVYAALQNPAKHCVVQIAPAVRVALGEDFGYPPGTLLTGKIYAALRRLGFDAVFDTNFGADLTIMEEGTEFVERFVHGKGELPLITSCCPSWTDYMEKFAPDFIHNFSTAKSPHAMVGALTKTYYAEKMGLDPKDIFMVSIMPCTAKKFEIQRSAEMSSSGQQDIDISLTTRELCRMIKSAGIDFRNLPEDERVDSLLGEYSGAGTIFGVTGGVMEAALRTAHWALTKERLPSMELKEIRGLDGVKEATLQVAGKEVRVAVAHCMGNIETVLDRVRAARAAGKETPYHFIEVMACRGGCVGGGGQPYGATDKIRRQRAAGIYRDDEKSAQRCSHENPMIQKLYADYLGAPLSKKSHQLLHTHYQQRKVYKR